MPKRERTWPGEGKEWTKAQALAYLAQQLPDSDELDLEACYVCRDCGSPVVDCPAWIRANTAQVTGDEGPGSYSFCNSCEQEQKYLDQVAEHTWPPAAPRAAPSFPPPRDPAELEQLATWIEHQAPGADIPALLRERARLRRDYAAKGHAEEMKERAAAQYKGWPGRDRRP